MKFTLNIRGRLINFERPAVMGIVNVTPDSFYAASRITGADDIARRAEALVKAGADMIDVGGYSSRPGAVEVSAEEELGRLAEGISAVRKAVDNDTLLSVDTFRAAVAEEAIHLNADIINDISGGSLDANMFDTVARLHVPYILMHMRGTPGNMQSLTDYSCTDGNVAVAVVKELSERLSELHNLGVADVIIDPGFGFAKTLDQNFALLRDLSHLKLLGCPILVGVSRKSMATGLLGISVDEALNATTVLNTLALERGASILRVHDPREAAQAIAIVEHMHNV